MRRKWTNYAIREGVEEHAGEVLDMIRTRPDANKKAKALSRDGKTIRVSITCNLGGQIGEVFLAVFTNGKCVYSLIQKEAIVRTLRSPKT